MNVKIKQIVEEGNDVFLLVQCCQPLQKETSMSNGRKELDENNMLFQKYSEEHRQEMNAHKKRMCQIHLGEATLFQEGVEE